MTHQKALHTIVLGLCILLLPVSISWSHPHVFLYNTVGVIFDEKGLAGFSVRWLFDEMFSSMIILDFDKNGNNLLEPPEIEGIRKNAFSNLRNFNYFIHVSINGKEFNVQYVTDFSAEVVEGCLVYQFFVPCHIHATETFQEICLSVYDHTFYCDVTLAENPVTYQKEGSYEITHRIETNHNRAYYYGQICPEEITLRFRRKNG